jgi:hypothetical protein
VCIDSVLAELNVPAEYHDTVWLRLEPLLRWTSTVTTPADDRTFGVFVTWKRRSIDRDVVDAMLVIDEPTCLALRRACEGRKLLLVDNTCLPKDLAA